MVRPLLILLLVWPPGAHAAAQSPAPHSTDTILPVAGRNGMVVTGEPIAARIGLQMLQRGGNAIDAAVSIGFVQAVTLPQAGNIGGGGFMLVHEAATGRTVAIDYRETAPSGAHRDMFLDDRGEADPARSRYSHLAAGVPGTVAGLALALDRFGTLSLSEALQPAIDLAERGFVVSPALSNDIRAAVDHLHPWPASRAAFLKPDGSVPAPGDTLVQRDLAATLRRVARHGVAGFYDGHSAALIEQEMLRHGGLITKQDLAAYRPIAREPVRGAYRGFEVHSMPPPSSGGVHIIQILNILEGYNLRDLGHNSVRAIHLIAEAAKRAYADRSEYLGDPAHYPVPAEGLTSKAYAARIRDSIALDTRTPSDRVSPGEPPGYESPQTTHYSVVDRLGNAVSNTYTLNFSFGSGIVVEGAGFLLNNEMDDFSAKPGVPNAYGLIGGEANAVAPGKRMLSSMSPTIVLRDGKPILVTGSPGGSRIITTTLQVIVNVIDHGMNLQEAVGALRVHHQWLPEELRTEQGLSPATVEGLSGMGYTVVVRPPMGDAASIMVDQPTGVLHGAADPRRQGLAAGY